jgi:pimeloyl-ACP methyl ester carboxylesterase
MSHLEHDWKTSVWSGLLGALAESHSLLRYDGRGMGLSDREVPISFKAAVDDLEVVVDAAGLERFALLGISQGVAVALAFAARRPERVSKLVLGGGD